MSFFGLHLFNPNRRVTPRTTSTEGASHIVVPSDPNPLFRSTQEQVNNSTSQLDTEDVNMKNVGELTASMSVQEWMRQTITVTDDAEHHRFLVKLGRLVFPVGYEQLCAETDRLLGTEVGPIPNSEYILDSVVKPVDFKKENSVAQAKKLAEGLAELRKPLQVKRALIEKNYES